jgi:hypothetical protein
MTRLTTNHAMLGPFQPRHPDGTMISSGRPVSIASIWQWLVAISEVAVRHRYASPLDQADRCAGMNATERR